MHEIELRNVNYLYEGSDRQVPARRDVSFAVEAAKFLCLVGQRGRGKTIMLDALTRDEMQGFLVDVWRETKMTVLYVTHNVAEAV